MNAQEARRIAFEFNTSESQGQYSGIKNKIHEAAKEGKYKVFIYENIKPDVWSKLTDEGFKIGDDQGKFNEVTIPITW